MVDESILKEIMIERKIEDMVRTIHQSVLSFYMHYRALNDIIQGSDDIQREIQHLRSTHEKLVQIKDISISELNKFREREEKLGLHLANKKVYDEAVMSMLEIVKDLEVYTFSLSHIITIVEDKGISEKDFKVGMQMTIDVLSRKYESFLTQEKSLTKALELIK